MSFGGIGGNYCADNFQRFYISDIDPFIAGDLAGWAGRINWASRISLASRINWTSPASWVSWVNRVSLASRII